MPMRSGGAVGANPEEQAYVRAVRTTAPEISSLPLRQQERVVHSRASWLASWERDSGQYLESLRLQYVFRFLRRFLYANLNPIDAL
jgi:hypothetical protein